MNTKKTIIRVADVMTRGVITVEPSATIRQAVQLMSDNRTSSLVVERRDVDDEFGLLTVADIAREVLARDLSPERVNVYEVMFKPVITLAAEMNVVYGVRLLSRFNLTRALVIDHDRNPLGIVTLRDLVIRGLTNSHNG